MNLIKKNALTTVIGLVMTFFVNVSAQDILNTSFEEYSPGSVHQQYNWSVENGSATVTNATDFVHTGSQALQFYTQSNKLVVKNIAFSGSESGVSGIIYFDVWVKVSSLETKDFSINGYDLYGGSQKRAFVFEFDTPSGNTGKFQVYDGSSKVTVKNYTLGQWYRISAKIDYNREIYQVIFDQSEAVTVNFRESYTPSHPNGQKEFHELRFNLGYDGAVGSVDAAIDDLYIGTNPIPDISFPPTEIYHTITVEQPEVGQITLDPQLDAYPDSSWVTASLEVPEGYTNGGWTGDLSGTEMQKTFQVVRDMTIGAHVVIDTLNPPAQYTVTVIQPDTGRIVLSPPGEVFYAYTKVTAKLELPVGFINAGWTGDLSGTELKKSFTVLSDMTIGATVVEDTTPPTIYTVNNAKDLKSICKGTNLKPGDIVEVEDGVYDTGGGITIESSGTANKPIIIRAKNIGQAELTGETYFTLRKVAYVTIQGFKFTSAKYTVIKLEACNHVRITRNIFQITETEGQNGKWVYIGGYWADQSLLSHHNRIDHNVFRDKHQLGNFITIDGGDVVSQHDRIDHNYFYNIGPRAENEMEAIRVGWSELSMTDGFTVIEYNLFEDCDGDPEIVSIKSCKDTVRYNTFRSSQGTLCLRHGNGSVVEGNFFLGEGKSGTGGIRIYSQDHKIYNNYFENLTGSKWDAAITLTNGDTDEGSLSAHWRIQNVLIAHNTLVNNYSNIEIGYAKSDNSWKKEPRNVTMLANLVVGGQRNLITIYTQPTNFVWQNNIMFPQNGFEVGMTATEDEIRVIDPLLEQRDSLWLLSAQSPAIDAANSNLAFLVDDVQGQLRDGLPDVGADEFSSAKILRRPLNPEDVGPFATDSLVSVDMPTVKVAQDFHLTNYPNPFNGYTVFAFNLPRTARVKLEVFDISGRKIRTILNSTLKAGSHRVLWQAGTLASGVYVYRLTTNRGVAQARKMILVK